MKYLILLILSTTAQASGVTVEDFIGRSVTLEKPANRIVALAPHIVENLYSAGAGDKLVGVVSYSNYPPEAQGIQQVGSYAAFSLETIVALQPDLILMWGSGNGMQALEKLEALGLPVFVSEPRQLSDISRSIRLLGKMAGTDAASEREALRIERETTLLKAVYGNNKKLSVLYQIWNDPLQTLNGEHLISQVIELCGGENIFRDTRSLAPKISIESVLLRNPQVIIASGMSAARPEWLDDWLKYPSLDAVKNKALISVNPDHIQRPTARVLLGARELCEKLNTVRYESPAI
ncbi:MAG: cobalamin-binding protein [Proteobacteria bacterium]|nr:cobalamin-binding protein [Pseudomonadota bacterium]